MSEAERKRRQDYKRNRKKWLIIQIIAIALIAVIAAGSFLIYDRMNRTYYIHYTEDGNIDYRVHLKENEFFDEEWLGKDQAYISSLIDNIVADFEYKLNMEASNVSFDYNYSIDAQLLITDNNSGSAIFDPEYEIVPEITASINKGNSLTIKEQVDIDYVKYNELAKQFIDAYGLKNVSSTLVVKLNVEVLSQCEEFEENSENSYLIALNVPLAAHTLNIKMTSSVPEAESKILACSPAINQNVFKIIGIIGASLDAVLAAILVAFIYLTRNEDINYTIKVQRLVSAYRSYIQQIEGDFDTEGHQVVIIKTFNEMLGIRDTIQSPILMSENADQTRTQFIIPTNTDLLYLFEIKVDNYDEIYAQTEADPEFEIEIVEEPATEATATEIHTVLSKEFGVEEIAKAMTTPDVKLDEIEFVDEEDEETEDGVEVIGVVWPEHEHKNKIYRYDPNGETLEDGDVVLIPSRDVHSNKDIVRKAAVAHGNHKVAPETLKYPLKKIIAVVRRKAEELLTTK